jgi:GNAT superfamily N-acetyltransferase
MSLEVHRATAARDFRDVRALFVAYEDELPARLRHGSVPGAIELQKAYAEPNAAFLAVSAGEGIGCVAVTRVDEETGLVRHLFVLPRSRGLGAARALVQVAIAFLRDRGYRRVVLDTEKDVLQPAYRLYRSLGFEECAPHGPVTYDTATFMELFL